MQRLSLRASWPLLAALILCVCGLNYGLPKIFAGLLLDVPLIPLLIIEVGASLAFALLFYDEAAPVQAIKISLAILAIVAVFAGLAYLANNEVICEFGPRPGSHAPALRINWVYLLAVNFSAIAVMKTLFVLSSAQTGGRKRQNRSDSDR